MGYRGYRPHGQWDMGNGAADGMGLMGYGPHGQWVQGIWATWGIWHNKVQGVWAIWAMGTHGAVGCRGMGYSGYQPLVKKMSNVK